jgi:hypothetical protein
MLRHSTSATAALNRQIESRGRGGAYDVRSCGSSTWFRDVHPHVEAQHQHNICEQGHSKREGGEGGMTHTV